MLHLQRVLSFGKEAMEGFGWTAKFILRGFLRRSIADIEAIQCLLAIFFPWNDEEGKQLSFIFHEHSVTLLVPVLWSFLCSNSFSSQLREINTAENVTRRETKRDDGPSAKRRRHAYVEGDTLNFIIMLTSFHSQL